jgi:acyl-CoA thioesterase-1
MVSLVATLLGSAANAASLRIVAIGASNTSGWGVGADDAYPAQLERLLRSKGIDASVTNAGIPFDTTVGMRVRLDGSVPDSTDLVILQPGANDRRFFGPFERRASNIAAMVSRLEARRIKVIVYDEVVPDRYYAWDGIHFNVEGHAMIAEYLMRQILATIVPQAPLAGSAAPKR